MIQGIEKAALITPPVRPPMAGAENKPTAPFQYRPPVRPPLARAVNTTPTALGAPSAPVAPQQQGFGEWAAENLNKVIPGLGLAGDSAGMYGGLGGAGLGAGGAFLLHMLLAKKKNRKISDYLKSMLMGSLLGGGLGYFGGRQIAPIMGAQAMKDPTLLARAGQQAIGFNDFTSRFGQDPMGALRGLIAPSTEDTNRQLAANQAAIDKAPKIPANTQDQESAEGDMGTYQGKPIGGQQQT